MAIFEPSPETPAEPGQPVYTVSRLNHEAQGLLESSFPLLWVEGELSNCSRPASGHLYCTLKDEQAQVRCVMFRGRNQLLRFQPEAGMRVRVRAQVSLYTPRGDFQLLIEQMEEAGEGALQRAFEELKWRLAEEGLFREELKRPLPAVPSRIGVITSESGAALRDVLTTLRRRFPGLPVVVYSVPVQGREAAPAIVAALQTANRRRDCDTLLLVRGGGSLEDLWAFNEPEVAYALRASDLPVVVGVGHEVDLTIADLAADLRAPTPTAAAERVSPDAATLLQQLHASRERLRRTLERSLQEYAQRLDFARRRLIHPGRRLVELRRHCETARDRLIRAFRLRLDRLRYHQAGLHRRLERASPMRRIQTDREALSRLQTRLEGAGQRSLHRRRERLYAVTRRLETVSPLHTLERGYAIVWRGEAILRRADEAAPGDTVSVQLAHGRLQCRVEAQQEEPPRD